MSLMVDIRKQYKNFELQEKLIFNGTALGLLGASGCGKSLTLKCIAGIETPDTGRIVLNGRILYDSELGINLPVQQRNVGMLFQNYALFPHMTVKKNIETGIRHKKDKSRQLEAMIRLFRLEGMLYKYPGQLSGGEQQRVALARSMSLEPELLMLDEPFYALDAFLKEKVQQELYKLLKEYRGEIIMVSHSRDELYRFCDTIAVIHQGHILESRRKDEIFCRPSAMATAKLTGCRNFSRAVRIAHDTVRALDWNIDLHTKQKVPKEVNYIGIRAHNIKACEGSMEENRLPVSLLELSEGPYEYKLLLQNKAVEGEKNSLWWIVTKQEWNKRSEGMVPEYICLPSENLLLFTE